MGPHFRNKVLAGMAVIGISGNAAYASPIDMDISGTTGIFDVSNPQPIDITPNPAPTWDFDLSFDGYTAGPFNNDFERNFQLSNIDWLLTYQNPENPSEILTNSGDGLSIVYRSNRDGGPADPNFSSITFTAQGSSGITLFRISERDAGFDLFPTNSDDLEAALFNLSAAFNDGSLLSANGFEAISQISGLDGPGSPGVIYDTQLDSLNVVPAPASAAVLGGLGVFGLRRRRSEHTLG